MKKLFLLFEDYHELVFLETMLKKIGWDTMGSQQEVGLAGKVLSFGPEVFLLQAKGKKIDGVKVAQKFRPKYPKSSMILVLHKNIKLDKTEVEQVEPDGIVTSPISPLKLFVALEKVGGIPAEEARKKLKSLKLNLPPEVQKELEIPLSEIEPNKPYYSITEISGAIEDESGEVMFVKTPKLSNEDRQKHYNSFLKEVAEPPIKVLDKQYVKKEMDELAKHVDTKENNKLNEQRQSFVIELFKKAKKNKNS